ncbi:MAG: dihydropteroate synthase [Rubripirellula sp.]
MGILNVTPDSFSDGGQNFESSAAIAAALQMEDDGAAIIDIGGESTRPYSEPVSEEEELRRVVPVIESLTQRLSIPISIDTSKSRVAEEAVAAGAEIINDVTGLEGDSRMPMVVNQYQVGVCVMHMQGTPQTMQNNPSYVNVVDEILEYLRARLDACVKLGIPRNRICLDPGIGFGKTHDHNLQLIRNAKRFLEAGTPILVGHSRKGFIGNLLGDKEADRTAATLGVSLALASHGIHIIRVHDVRQTVDALKLYLPCMGDR